MHYIHLWINSYVCIYCVYVCIWHNCHHHQFPLAPVLLSRGSILIHQKHLPEPPIKVKNPIITFLLSMFFFSCSTVCKVAGILGPLRELFSGGESRLCSVQDRSGPSVSQAGQKTALKSPFCIHVPTDYSVILFSSDAMTSWLWKEEVLIMSFQPLSSLTIFTLR
jgi:hypothetical protein